VEVDELLRAAAGDGRSRSRDGVWLVASVPPERLSRVA
jgi:RNA:NAD 2'-phosphotransferase (TPT1/KptA family)